VQGKPRGYPYKEARRVSHFIGEDEGLKNCELVAEEEREISRVRNKLSNVPLKAYNTWQVEPVTGLVISGNYRAGARVKGNTL